VIRGALLALILLGCSRSTPAPTPAPPAATSRTWNSGRIYFYGHEIVAPLTLTRYDSALTLKGFHRVDSRKLEPTPELVVLRLYPGVSSPPASSAADADSDQIVLKAAAAYGKWARKGGASSHAAADSVVAFLRRSERVTRAGRGGGISVSAEFKSGYKYYEMGREEETHTSPSPPGVIEDRFRSVASALDSGSLMLIVQSGWKSIPGGQREFPDSVLRHPPPELAERLERNEEYLDDSVPLARFAWPQSKEGAR